MRRPTREDVLGTWSIRRWMWAFAALAGTFAAEAAIVIYLVKP